MFLSLSLHFPLVFIDCCSDENFKSTELVLYVFVIFYLDLYNYEHQLKAPICITLIIIILTHFMLCYVLPNFVYIKYDK